MREITKAQLTIGLLSYFATVWDIVVNPARGDIVYILGFAILQLFLLLVLSYVIIALLEWVKVFDLKTNAILALLVLVTLNLLSILKLS
jgi:hypothetical protein